jgi:hypothetical protein
MRSVAEARYSSAGPRNGAAQTPMGCGAIRRRPGLGAFLLLVAASFACGPQGPLGVIPGGPLSGERAAWPADGWAFTEELLTVAIETEGGWLDHSVTVLCMTDAGSLYIPSRHGGRKKWVNNALRDPRVRIGAQGQIFEGRAVRVMDATEADRVARGFVRKYMGLDAERAHWLLDPPGPDDDRADVWLFRIDPPPAVEGFAS